MCVTLSPLDYLLLGGLLITFFGLGYLTGYLANYWE